VYVHNQCENGSCVALTNFWRSVENLTINVTTPGFGCYTGEFWAVSQAAPMRRVDVNGNTTLMDYCTGAVVRQRRLHRRLAPGQRRQRIAAAVADAQQHDRQLVERRLEPGLLRRRGRPAECFPATPTCGGPYTVVAASPIIPEAPFLYVDSAGRWKVFVPAPRRNAVGPSWTSGTPAGRVPVPEGLRRAQARRRPGQGARRSRPGPGTS
jgi:hypothetical protein